MDFFFPNKVYQVLISDCIFMHNIAGDTGGAIYFDQEFGIFIYSSSCF